MPFLHLITMAVFGVTGQVPAPEIPVFNLIPLLQNLQWPAAIVIVAWLLLRAAGKRSPVIRCFLAITKSLKVLDQIIPILEGISDELKHARLTANAETHAGAGERVWGAWASRG